MRGRKVVIHVIEMTGVKNGWIHNVDSFQIAAAPSGFHLQSGGVFIKQSKNITVADSAMKFAQNRGAGGNGYLFEVMQSNEILFRDCVAKAGRHNLYKWILEPVGLFFYERTVLKAKPLILKHSKWGLLATVSFTMHWPLQTLLTIVPPLQMAGPR